MRRILLFVLALASLVGCDAADPLEPEGQVKLLLTSGEYTYAATLQAMSDADRADDLAYFFLTVVSEFAGQLGASYELSAEFDGQRRSVSGEGERRLQTNTLMVLAQAVTSDAASLYDFKIQRQDSPASLGKAPEGECHGIMHPSACNGKDVGSVACSYVLVCDNGDKHCINLDAQNYGELCAHNLG